MVKHTQTICRQQPVNCLSVLDHFVGLALKRLMLWQVLAQRSKFVSAVGKCRGISPFYSICLGNKNAEAVKFLEIKKKVFLELKNKFLVKEKKIYFIKKSFLLDTTY